MKTLNWQIVYLNCFYDVVSELFSYIRFANREEKIEFYATAYNHGFNLPEEDIYNWKDKAVFPYGVKSDAKQYKYSDISVQFYKKEYNKIFN